MGAAQLDRLFEGGGLPVDPARAMAALGAPGAGRWVLSDAIDARTEALLDAVPSEASQAERAFLYNFMRAIWDGVGDVLDVGPYLGGTTRALGLGMAHNPRGQARRLIALDRFERYHRPERLREETLPLWAARADAQEIEQEIARGRWRKLFEATHRPTSYGRFLEIAEAALPDRREEPIEPALAHVLPAGAVLGVVCIDGCASWRAIKALMQTLIAHARQGAWFFVRGYGRHTNFWLPSFFETFSGNFTLTACVSATYAFQYRGKLTPAQIERRFPDAPEDFAEQDLEDIFTRLYRAATIHNDARATLIYPIQHAAAMATIGRQERAKEIIAWLEKGAVFTPHARTIAEARARPTFTPDRVVALDWSDEKPSREGAPAPKLAAKKCNICGGASFTEGFQGRMAHGVAPMCRKCGSAERHRAIRALYEPLRPLIANWRALQFAPDHSVAPSWFKEFVGSIYGTPPFFDMMNIDLEDAAFDIVLSNHVLEHVSDDARAVRECLRVAGEAGVVHFAVPSPMHFWATNDWGFADPEKNEHFRDYGADFAMRMARAAPGAAIMAAPVRDPVTDTPDIVYFLSRAPATLEAMGNLLLGAEIPAIRVA